MCAVSGDDEDRRSEFVGAVVKDEIDTVSLLIGDKSGSIVRFSERHE